MRPTRCYIDLNKLIHNYNYIKTKLHANVKFCAILKANAYGHGIEAIAPRLASVGIDCFGVACLKEAKRVRDLGITIPVYLLGLYLPEEIDEAISLNVIPFVFNKEQILLWDKASKARNKISKVHFKVNTGMGRLGCNISEVLELLDFIKNHAKNLELEGLASHFASSDDLSKSDTQTAINTFDKIIKHIEPPLEIYHIANSDGTLHYENSHFNMVRVGLALYGYSSNKELAGHLKPVLTFSTKLVNIRLAKKDELISYGGTYKVEKDRYIGVLPVGYADGYPRLLSNKARVFIGGKYYHQIGNICMDQMMIDLGETLEAKLYDDVILFDGNSITPAELANLTGTIPYEILTSLSQDRIDRIII